MKTGSLMFYALLLVGCSSSQTSDKEHSKTESTFDQYLSETPILNLPYEISCETDLTAAKHNIPDKLLAKHKPEGAIIHGRFKNS